MRSVTIFIDKARLFLQIIGSLQATVSETVQADPVLQSIIALLR